jgi:hypothetical protein
MFIYTNSTGNHVCQGMDDLQKAEGANFDLSPMIVSDESGAVIGVQTKHCTWQDSIPLIKAMRDEDVMLKAQTEQAQLRKAFRPAQPLHRTSSQQAAASRSNQAGFTRLLSELDTMKRNQNQFMKAMSW